MTEQTIHQPETEDLGLDKFYAHDNLRRPLFRVEDFVDGTHADDFRRCAIEYMEGRMAQVVDGETAIGADEAWVHRLLLEMINAVYYVAIKNDHAYDAEMGAQ